MTIKIYRPSLNTVALWNNGNKNEKFMKPTIVALFFELHKQKLSMCKMKNAISAGNSQLSQ